MNTTTTPLTKLVWHPFPTDLAVGAPAKASPPPTVSAPTYNVLCHTCERAAHCDTLEEVRYFISNHPQHRTWVTKLD